MNTSILRATFALVCATASVSCAMDSSDELLGEATATIAVAPTGVRCIRLAVEGGGNRVESSKDVTPGAPTTFQMNRLPLGAVSFSGEAFDVACASVTAASVASFVADPVPASLLRGVRPTVTLQFRPSGSATVIGDFLDDTGVPDTGFDTGAIDTAVVDTGTVDTGTVDTAVPDTGSIDTGSIDTGTIDTGTIDTAVADTGSADTGSDDTDAAVITNNIMFVTSGVRYPDLGLAGADAYCNERAAAAGLTGSYVAWLSTSTVNAISRIAGSRGWVRPDGVPFADRPEDLAAGRVLSTPSVTELGTRSNYTATLTGTAADGTATTSTCSNWSSRAVGATNGDINGSVGTWTASHYGYGCNQPAPFYCFGVGRTAPLVLPPPPAAAPKAFISNAAWSPSGGRAGADAFCQAEATSAGLPGVFVAFLYTSTSTARSRLGALSRYWYRVDGLRLGNLTDLTFDAPLSVTSTGNYVSDRVWIGSGFDSLPMAITTCNDWTSASHDYDAIVSRLSSGSTVLDNDSIFARVSCDAAPRRLYCFQQ